MSRKPLKIRGSSRRPGCVFLFLLIGLAFCTAAGAAPPVRTVVQSGHTMDVISVTFAPDESLFASLDRFGRIKVWKAPEGRLLRSFRYEPPGQSKPVDEGTLAFDGKGRLVVISNGTVSRFDPLTGEKAETTRLGFPDDAGYAVSANGAVIASWQPVKNGSTRIDLWDTGSGRLVRTMNTPGDCDVVLSPTGKTAACLSASGPRYSIRLWHTGDGSMTESPPSGPSSGAKPNLLAVNDDGSLVVVHRETPRAPMTDSLQVRRTSDMSAAKDIPLAGPGLGAAFSEDGRYIVTTGRPAGSKTERIRVIDTAQWNTAYESDKRAGTSLAVSPTARFVAEGAGGMMGSGAFYLTYLITLHDLKTRSGRAIYSEGKWTDHIALSPDGRYLVLNEQRGLPEDPRAEIVLSRLKLIDLRDGGIVWEKEAEDGDRFKGIAWSHNGKYLAARDLETLFVWEMPAGRPVKKIPLASDKFHTGLAMSPDGLVLAAVDGTEPLKPRTVLINVSDGKRLRVLPDTTPAGKTVTEALSFSPDGRYIARTLVRDIAAGATGNSAYEQEVYVEVHDRSGSERPRVINAGRYSEKESPRSLDRGPIATDVLAFSSDGGLLLVGRKVFKVSEGSQVRLIRDSSDLSGLPARFYAGGARALSVSSQGSIYAEQAEDGGIRIMGLAQGMQRATLYTFPGSSVTVTPEGFFSGYGDFHSEVHFAIGSSIYDFNQFYDTFYRPDLVIMKLQGSDISSFSAGLNIADALKNPPPVPVLSASGSPERSARRLKVGVSVTDFGGGIGDIRLFNNGKLVYSRGIYRVAGTPAAAPAGEGPDALKPYRIATRGVSTVSAIRRDETVTITPATPFEKVQEFSFDIELIRGRNTIALTAFNGPNTVMSALKTMTVDVDIPERKSRLFGLIIGNDHFRNKDIGLSYAVKDARDLAALIRKTASGLFGEVAIDILPDAPKPRVMKALDDAARKMHPEDVFIFFAASHGFARDDLYYLFTPDFDGTSITAGNSISSVELTEFSKMIPSLRQIYILDTCQAGAAGAVALGLYDSRISVLARSLGLHILAGASTYQEAIDNYEGNGFFTHFLLEGFGGKADGNRDRKITIMEMNPYLSGAMKAASGGRQVPLIRNFGDDFVITRVR